MNKTDILRINKAQRENIKDVIVQEVPLTIYLNNEELLTLLCSPDNLKELSTGFIYSSGLIKSNDEIRNIIIDTERWAAHVDLKNKNSVSKLMFKRLYSSGCGRGTIFYNALDPIRKKRITSNIRISPDKITKLINSFQNMSVIYKETGGVHSAALSDTEKILVFKEDIGRHNAIDKIIGEALIKNIDMKDLIMLSSGRVSSEIISKVQRTGSAFLVSRSAPTDQAVSLAGKLNLTLIGFARGQRMNVYTAAERII